MSDHMKRLAMPKTWPIPKKVHLWATKQSAGAHSVENSMPATLVLRDMLKVCDTASEAKKIVAARDLIVNGKAVKDAKAPIGIMDVVSIPAMDLYYRVVLSDKGKIAVVAITKDEASWKLSMIENKTKVAGGKIQLNFHDGRNIVLDANKYKTGDVLKISVPDQKIEDAFELKAGATVLVISGRHIGAIETVEKYTVVNRPTENIVTFKSNTETVKANIFVIGTGKSELPEVSE